jgi:hypothetical protein
MTELLPLFPLGTVLVPDMSLSLHVFEPRYRQLVADLLGGGAPGDPALSGVPEFGVVALRQGFEVGEGGEVYDVGTTARLTDVYPQADGRYEVTAIGGRRFLIEAIERETHPYLLASVRYLPEPDGIIGPGTTDTVRSAWENHLRALVALSGHPVTEIEAAAPELTPSALSYAVAQLSSLPVADRQFLLGCADTGLRLGAARRILRRETTLIRQLHAIPASPSMFSTRTGPSRA